MIENMYSIFCDSLKEAERLMDDTELFKGAFKRVFSFGDKSHPFDENIFAEGDNLKFMLYLLHEREMEGKFRLIYIDPPFFSKSKYDSVYEIAGKKVRLNTYSDVWKSMEEYLYMLCIRLHIARRLLSDEGSIWIHMDWHAVHYVKVLMDEIFGRNNFVNEVVWTYKSGGSTSRRFARKHDTLLFYSKTKNYYFSPVKEKSYNRGLKPYRFRGVEEFEDETGWYTLVNKKDVWVLDMVGRTSSERTGYATQKPVKLLEQILESCSKEGDICADFFAGSGALAKACRRLSRRFISCDIERQSVREHVAGLLCEGEDMPKTGVYSEGRDFSAVLRLSAERNESGLLISVDEYAVPDDSIPIKGEYIEHMKSLSEKHNIYCWLADVFYDDDTYEEKTVLRDRSRGETETSVVFEKTEGALKADVTVVDIYGNITKGTIEL